MAFIQRSFAVKSCFKYFKRSFTKYDIPSPKQTPLLGHLHLFSPLGPYRLEKIVDALFDLRQKYGSIVRLKLGLEMVVVFNPKDAATVLRNEGVLPNRPPFEALLNYRRSNPHLYNRMGLFTDNGEDWSYMRKLTTDLLRSGVAEKYLQAQNGVAEDFMSHIKSMLVDDDVNKEKQFKDILSQLYKYTQEAFGLVVFGGRLGCFSSLSSTNVVNEAVSLSLDSLGKTLLGIPWWKLKVPSKTYTNLCSAQRILRNVTEDHLDQSDFLSADERGVYLNSLLERKDLDRRDLITTLLELFHAGIDATASTIAFCLYHIARHPHVQDKIIEEIDALQLIHKGITVSFLQEAKYLRTCVKETTRLTPATGGTARVLPKSIKLSKYTVDAGTFVLCSHPVMSRDENLVEDPNTFNPDRWPMDGTAGKIPPFVTLPFSFGLRMCPGRRFAEQEILLFLIQFFQNFRCVYKEKGEVGSVMRLNLLPDKSINLIVTERQKIK